MGLGAETFPSDTMRRLLWRGGEKGREGEEGVGVWVWLRRGMNSISR